MVQYAEMCLILAVQMDEVPNSDQDLRAAARRCHQGLARRSLPGYWRHRLANHRAYGFIDNWAVVQIYSTQILKLNSVGNDINRAVAVDKRTVWIFGCH